MFKQATAAVLLGAIAAMSGCGGSGGDPTTAPSTTQERIREDLHAAGQGIKDAASQAAAEIKPALEHAKEEGRQVIHDAASKIAERTATQPAPVAPQ